MQKIVLSMHEHGYPKNKMFNITKIILTLNFKWRIIRLLLIIIN